MSEQLFTTELGYRIEDDSGNAVDIIITDGPPGGTTESDAAAISSIAMDFTNGIQYTKKTSGAGTDKWTSMASQEYVDAAATGLSWREPAKVKDDTVYADLTAAETAMNTGTVDSIAVADGDRILYQSISGENSNVFTITGTVGAGATLVEDSNLQTDGDAIFIQEGTHADTQWSYNGSSWVQVGGTTSSEIGFLRAFIGKDASGSELPAYTSQVYITNGDSLESAIGSLDAAADANATAIGGINASVVNLQTEINAIETSLGGVVNASGVYQPFTGTNYLDGNTSLTQDLTDLDSALDSVATAVLANDTDIGNLQTEINATQTGAGLGTGGGYTADAGSNYIITATSLFNADQLLDAQIKQNADDIASLQLGSTEDAFMRSFMGKDAAGAETPTYTSTDNVTQSATLEAAIGELDAAIGDISTAGNFTPAGGPVADSLSALDTKLDDAHHEIANAASGAAWTTIDTVAVGDAVFAKWLVHFRTGQNVVTWEVDATHNAGAGGTPVATQVDFTKFAKLRIGNIAGSRVRVELVGQDMVLQVRDNAGTSVINAVRELIIDV